jgi:DNA-binding MarR family transcriptional regulator
MESTNDTSSVYRFFNELGIMEQLVTARLEAALPNGLNKSQFGVLNHMVRLNRVESPAQLASAFQVKRPTMTNTIQKLESKGFVEVKSNPADGRGKIVAITESGREIREQALASLTPMFQEIATGLGIDVFEKAAPYLEKVRIYLDENR